MTVGHPSGGVAIDLSGRVALVTGAGGGIGREIACTLARAGARVAVNDIDAGRADETVGVIVSEAGAAPGPVRPASSVAATGAAPVARTVAGDGAADAGTTAAASSGIEADAPFAVAVPGDATGEGAAGGGVDHTVETPPATARPSTPPLAVAVAGDVTDEGDVEAIVGGAVEELGRLDIAVNNVGMLGGLGPRRVAELDAAYIRRVVDLNLISTLLCCAAEARAMTAAGRPGVIVNVSSGETTRAAPGLAVYAAAKAAVNHLTRSLAVELGPADIRAHAVAPGTTPTDEVRARLSEEHLDAIAASTPLQRHCRPDDLAGLVLLLVSDLASAVTGQLVLADVGAHLSLSRPSIPLGGSSP